MSLWINESIRFGNWLGKQGMPTILPPVAKKAGLKLDELSSADLVSVMFNAEGQQALEALDQLKFRFEYEMYVMNENNRNLEEMYAGRGN